MFSLCVSELVSPESAALWGWTAFASTRCWSGKRDSNSRPQPWQGCALPTELFPHGMAALGGFAGAKIGRCALSAKQIAKFFVPAPGRGGAGRRAGRGDDGPAEPECRVVFPECRVVLPECRVVLPRPGGPAAELRGTVVKGRNEASGREGAASGRNGAAPGREVTPRSGRRGSRCRDTSARGAA